MIVYPRRAFRESGEFTDVHLFTEKDARIAPCGHPRELTRHCANFRGSEEVYCDECMRLLNDLFEEDGV